MNQATDHITPIGTVLITGASGGFGREFARRLEARGYALILHGRNAEKLQSLRESLAHPEWHRCFAVDIGDTAGVNSLLGKLVDDTICGLVNNAGFGLWGGFADREVEEQLSVIRTDLCTPIALTHALLPQLISQQGFVINVSSLAGEYPLPYMSSYAAAKAGLSYWSEALRIEMENRLRIVTLVPGPSPTGFRDISGMASGPGSFFRTQPRIVIECALRTLDNGGGYCVPGWRHRLLWLLQKSIPRFIGLQIMAGKLRGN
ncbi:MAG TPA: SDR family NAD(P)-dependent oxidoreductase [Mariprofundaceae bacterium]|nr:SDR family NAD(P)-dependent oxidoreductase [Mariprofundaceae bacterium]